MRGRATAARLAHNQQVAGSNPALATKFATDVACGIHSTANKPDPLEQVKRHLTL